MATAAQKPCYCQRRRSYKQMVQDIADNLGNDDVRRIVYLYDLPRELGDKTGLEVLQLLERRGLVCQRDTEQLESLLKEINRFDLIERHLVGYRKLCRACETKNTKREIPGKSVSKEPGSDQHPPRIKVHENETSTSTRLHAEDKHELRQLISRYVPVEVIHSSKLLNKIARLTRSTEYMEGSEERDGTSTRRSTNRSTNKSGDIKYRSASMSRLASRKKDVEVEEWIVLDESSITDSGTGSGSSFDNDSSLDIDIGDISPAQLKKDVVASNERLSEKERRYFTWRIRRSEFMIPLFQHTNKTFEKKVKLCMGHKGHCLPIHFILFPNGIGSDENIYSSFRIVLPSASQLVPPGTSLVFSITVRDMRTADILATRYMEIGLERDAYLLEQFMAHEVIKSSQARHLEIRVMTKVNASSRGWVQIQSRKT